MVTKEEFTNLEFKKCESWHPNFVCQVCGKSITENALLGDIEIMPSHTYTITLCSTQCVQDLKQNPTYLDAINKVIQDIKNNVF